MSNINERGDGVMRMPVVWTIAVIALSVLAGTWALKEYGLWQGVSATALIGMLLSLAYYLSNKNKTR